jgi:hypothetical protein
MKQLLFLNESWSCDEPAYFPALPPLPFNPRSITILIHSSPSAEAQTKSKAAASKCHMSEFGS